MRRLIKTMLWAALLALPLSAGFAVPSMSGGPALHLLSSCDEMDKDYTQLISLSGEALPMGTGYLAYKDLGDGRAAVYRQTPPEVTALIRRNQGRRGCRVRQRATRRVLLAGRQEEPLSVRRGKEGLRGRLPEAGLRMHAQGQGHVDHDGRSARGHRRGQGQEVPLREDFVIFA